MEFTLLLGRAWFTNPDSFVDSETQNLLIDTKNRQYLFFYRFLPESCRYLLVNKRKDDALKQLKTVARWNGKTMPKVELEIPKEIVSEKSDVRDLFYDKSVGKITVASWISW